jgi:hypothetical protein
VAAAVLPEDVKMESFDDMDDEDEDMEEVS